MSMKANRNLANLYVIKYLFRIAPGYVVGYFLDVIWTYMIAFIANVLIFKVIIDAVMGGMNAAYAFCAVAAMILFFLGGDIYTTWFHESFERKAKEMIAKRVYDDISKRTLVTDWLDYDDPEYYNDVVLAMEAITEKADETLMLVADAAATVINAALTLAMYFTISPGLLVIMCASITLTLLINKRMASTAEKKQSDTVQYRRRLNYIKDIFAQTDYAKEIRIYNAFGTLFKKYKESNAELRSHTLNWNKRLMIMNFVQKFVPEYVFMHFGLVMYLVYDIMVRKTSTIGGFVAAFNSVELTVSTLTYLFGTTIAELKVNGTYMAKFRTFMDKCNIATLEVGRENSIQDFSSCIVFENVTFSYPNQPDETLKDISFKINKGQHIAIVGLNGAGKSTLINVLLGLLKPEKGSVHIDGKDISDIPVNVYRGQFETLFQDFQLYPATVAQNVAMDDKVDIEKVRHIVAQSGIWDNSNTMLDRQLLREFCDDGLILSGGERQKLALARLKYSDAPIIVLDEPSSALDPISEYHFNQEFEACSKDKTVIYVSHRLATVKDADFIYVLANGKIVESGTHNELLRINGLYSDMWHIQADKYEL